jgi:hypothetical protein
MCDLLEEEPTCFEEAIQRKEWADAMTEEYQSIMKNEVWEIVPRPKIKMWYPLVQNKTCG